MDGHPRNTKIHKTSPKVKKIVGARKTPTSGDEIEAQEKDTVKKDKRPSKSRGLSRKSPVKQVHVAWGDSGRHDAASPARLSGGQPEQDEDVIAPRKKGSARNTHESPTRKVKEERHHRKQSPGSRMSQMKTKQSSATRKRFKSLSPSRRKSIQGNKMRMSFDQKEWAMRHNKYGRSSDAISPVSLKTGRSKKKSSRRGNVDCFLESDMTTGSSRPLCTPNNIFNSLSSGDRQSNDSSAVYPLESLDSLATISDHFVSESFPPIPEDNPCGSVTDCRDADLRDAMLKDDLEIYVDSNEQSPEKFSAQRHDFHNSHRSLQCVRTSSPLTHSEGNNSDCQPLWTGKQFKQCEGKPNEGPRKENAAVSRRSTGDVMKMASNSSDRYQPGYRVARMSSDKGGTRKPSDDMISSEQQRLKRGARKVSSSETTGAADNDRINDDRANAKPSVFAQNGSNRPDNLQGNLVSQKRKSPDIFKVHVRAQNVQACQLSPKVKAPLSKNTKEVARSLGDTSLQKNTSSATRKVKEATTKARASAKLETHSDSGKETAPTQGQTVKVSEAPKSVPRTSPRVSLCKKQGQAVAFGTYVKPYKEPPATTQRLSDSKILSYTKSKSSLASEKNHSEKVSRAKTAAVDFQKDVPKIQSSRMRQSPKLVKTGARELNGADAACRERGSPEKRFRQSSKSVAPVKCQAEVNCKVKLHSAPNKSDGVAPKQGQQKSAQNRSVKAPSSSSSVLKFASGRGGGGKEKCNAGGSLMITPLYGTSMNSTDKCGPNFLENLANVTASSNESWNKSTEGIICMATKQLQKIQELNSFTKKPKIVPNFSRFSLLKSKSLLTTQASNTGSTKVRRVSSVGPRTPRPMDRYSARHSVPEVALPFATKTTPPSVAIENRGKSFQKTKEKCQLLSDLENPGVIVHADQKRINEISLREIESQLKPEIEVGENFLPLSRTPSQLVDNHLPSSVLNVCTENYLKMTLVNENGNKIGSQSALRKETLIPQSITHQTTQIKQCCIKVASIDEARDVAKSLMTSAYRDIETASRWVSEISDLPVATANNLDGVDNATSETQFRMTNCEEREEIFLENVGSDVDGIASPKMKHCRRVTASPGEINLLTPSLDPNCESSKALDPPVNVRKIDFEPMICIPLAESESAQKVDHQDTGTDCQSFCVQIKKPQIAQEINLKAKVDISTFSAAEDLNNLETEKNNRTETLDFSSPREHEGIEKAKILPDESFDNSTHEIIEDITPGYLVQNVMDKDVTECDTDREMTMLTNREISSRGIYQPCQHTSPADQVNEGVPMTLSDTKEDASDRAEQITTTHINAQFQSLSRVAALTVKDHTNQSTGAENSVSESVHENVTEKVEGIEKVDEEILPCVAHVDPERNELSGAEPLSKQVTFAHNVTECLANAGFSSRDCELYSRGSESAHSSLAEDTTTIMNLNGDESVRGVDSGSLEDSSSVTIHNLSQEHNLDQTCLARTKSPEASVHSDESRISVSGLTPMTLDSISAISVHSCASQDCPASGPCPEGSCLSSKDAHDAASQDSLIVTPPTSLQNIQERRLDSTCNHRSKGSFIANSPEKVEHVPKTQSTSPGGSWRRVKTFSSPSKKSPDGDAPPLCDQLDMQMTSPSINEKQREKNKRIEVSKLQELYENLNATKIQDQSWNVKPQKRDVHPTTDFVKKIECTTKDGGALESCRPPAGACQKNFPLGSAVVQKEGQRDSSDFLRTPAWTVVQKTEKRPEKRQKSETNKMDLSTDSFNSLFMENALYLEDISNTEKNGTQSVPKTAVPRKLKVKKLSFHKKSKEDETKRTTKTASSSFHSTREHRSLAADDNLLGLPSPTSEAGTNSLAQEAAYLEGQFSTTSESCSQAVQDTESLTLCLSDITECNVTRSSFTDRITFSPRGNAQLLKHTSSKPGRDFGAAKCDPARQKPQDAGCRVKGGVEGENHPKSSVFSANCESSAPARSSARSHEATDGRASVTNEEVDTGLVRAKVDEMEARRRRRFLERSSDVSGEESVSWRSRIYQKETTQEPPSNWRGEKAEQRRSHAVSQNEDQEMTGSAGRRRRKGDDGGSNELAERLARRRAQRLEEQSENSSHDGSVDGSRLSDRRWSRDDSVRSVDSSDNGDVVDSGVSVRRTRRSKGDHFSNTTTTNNSNNNGVNVMENGKNITHSGEVCRNGDGKVHGTTSRLSRHRRDEDAYRWNSKDSANGISLSSDAGGDIYSSSSSMQSKKRTSSRLQSGDFDPSEDSGGPKAKPVHELSKDSAFSESREKSAEPRDIANSSNNANNSNNNSTTAQETLLEESASSALAYRARRIQDYINDCEDGQSGPRTALSAAKDNRSDSTEPVSDDHQQRRRTRATGQSSSLDSGSRRLSADDENMAEKESVVEDGFRARLRRMRGVEAEETEGFKVISNSISTSSQESTLMDSVHMPLSQAPGAPETDPRANHAERDQELEGGHLEQAVTCDTTTAAAPPEPERRRRRRVDKSALRKSPLNMDTGVTEELDGEYS